MGKSLALLKCKCSVETLQAAVAVHSRLSVLHVGCSDCTKAQHFALMGQHLYDGIKEVQLLAGPA